MSKRTKAENEAPEVVEMPVEEGTTPTVEETPTPAPKKAKVAKAAPKVEVVEGEVMNPKLSDTELERLKHADKKKYTQYIINQQPTVRMMIPSEGLAKGTMMHKFIINGAEWEYPVGEMIDVPEQIADMIQDRFSVKHNMNPFRVIDGEVQNVGL